MRYLTISAAALCALAACRGGGRRDDTARAAAMSPADSARAAARTANAIAANPAAADSILAASGYTRDGFQEFMYRVAGDSAMSAAYAAVKSP